ncbi:unnamed protein product [Lupinus luteus]|uniref:Uncharacterized protein n=1 Tax=Lupinus luteus TaxID=3873 RepID=A0AAV1WKA4_LUPLU
MGCIGPDGFNGSGCWTGLLVGKVIGISTGKGADAEFEESTISSSSVEGNDEEIDAESETETGAAVIGL